VLSLNRGRVTAIVERHEGLVRLEVDGTACVAYPDLTGPVALDDEVLVNVQARVLGLGSGGFDVLYANLTRGLGLSADAGAHVMKLPYAPLQAAAIHGEEAGELAETLQGMPVVCCSLHSQLAPACAGLRQGVRVAYVQLAGGALPLPLSDAVRELKGRGLVTETISVGACFGGDLECVNVASALACAASRGFDVAVCAIGPGIVGTGSFLGHGGLAAAEAANAALALGGSPVLAPRFSEADERERHRGLSHHTRAVLALCLGEVAVAWPAGLEAPPPGRLAEADVDGWEEACAGLPLSHMGRGRSEDPWFFAAAYAAGRVARTLVG
jgi:Protein of unknown function (DUF3866)